MFIYNLFTLFVYAELLFVKNIENCCLYFKNVLAIVHIAHN